jgi:hypothetical protein
MLYASRVSGVIDLAGRLAMATLCVIHTHTLAGLIASIYLTAARAYVHNMGSRRETGNPLTFPYGSRERARTSSGAAIGVVVVVVVVIGRTPHYKLLHNIPFCAYTYYYYHVYTSYIIVF